MRIQINSTLNPTTYTYSKDKIHDLLKICNGEQNSIKKTLLNILTDTSQCNNISLGEYYPQLHCYINNITLKNNSINECVDWLIKEKFKNFNISKIFVRYEPKEIIVVSNNINNDVLDEFYEKTFNFKILKDIEIVFMISTISDINFSAMPKCDKVIEVSDYE